ncbi:MAG TPA: hypothetical protein VK671_16900 [Mucilaginibacter sp.]|jgi:hypothetical protein|nr:hypothetical protein [Mucilaginibacter sp.]
MNSERGNRKWLNDYMSLKQVNPNSPFTVPDGYFDELEQQIASYIKLDDLKTSSPSNGFVVPENYFEELSDNINSRIVIEETADKEATGFTVPEDYFDELSQQIQSRIAVDDALNKSEDTFTVPHGYFDELSQNIQSRIAVEEALSKSEDAFTVPEGYFNELSLNIQSRIAVEEALNEPEESFAVPGGYFDKLTENILNKTVNQEAEKKEAVKRKGIVRQLFVSSAFKYATAACVTLAVGATILLSQNNNVVESHKNSFLHKSLSQISVDDIKEYLQSNVDQNDTHTLIDESKQVNADNLSNDLQDELDTSQ